MNKRRETELEPLVSDEQGVVYLFSKYWERLELDIEELERIRSRFPDGRYYNSTNKWGGIEFQYKLSGFKREHLDKKKENNLYDFMKRKEVESKFYVVYWIDDDKNTKDKLKKKYKKDIEFINLSENFIPYAIKMYKQITPYLVFNKSKISKKTKGSLYSYPNIKKKYSECIRKDKHKEFVGSKESFVKGEYKSIDEDYYRVLGHNLKKADDVSIEHWRYIHFYTTTSKITCGEKIPYYIFFKSADKDYISILIQPKIVFISKKNKIKKFKDFYEKFYFYLFEPYISKKEEVKYIIYDKIWEISKKDGKELSKLFLKGNAKFNQNMASIYNQKDPERFNKIKKITNKYNRVQK